MILIMNCNPTAVNDPAYLWADPVGASGDPGRPVCRQPPAAAGAPQSLLPLPHPGKLARTHMHAQAHMSTHKRTLTYRSG